LINVLLSIAYSYFWLISGAGIHCPKDSLQLPFSTWEIGKKLL
jgi:hypothetical protein